MRVLVVGGGGREHALVWQLVRFGHDVHCAPGNAGILRQARCVPLSPTDVPALAEYARKERIDLTIVGPEAPLVAGLADWFRGHGLRVFGPCADGARLEGDKAFAKQLMEEQGIPTARFGVFESLEPALGYLANQTVPVVIKAAGLAAGKGVVIARTLEEARLAVSGMLSGTSFGAAGRKVVVEEWLEGEEASIIGLCDGEHFVLLVPSQDHKRLRDNDEGPNTGGMGAYAPAPVVTREVEKQAADRVFGPAIAGLRRRGIDYRGVIYAGVMLTRQGLRLLEFNCRFGDPETQAVMPLLGTDLAELAVACIDGRLAGQAIKWSGGSALCVVAAAPGYPESYPRGVPIAGLAPVAGDLVVFHAGTRLHEGQVVTDGGRVLGVTGMGLTLSAARDAAYRGIEQIRFEGMHFRKDIGARGLRAASQVRA